MGVFVRAVNYRFATITIRWNIICWKTIVKQQRSATQFHSASHTSHTLKWSGTVTVQNMYEINWIKSITYLVSFCVLRSDLVSTLSRHCGTLSRIIKTCFQLIIWTNTRHLKQLQVHHDVTKIRESMPKACETMWKLPFLFRRTFDRFGWFVDKQT